MIRAVLGDAPEMPDRASFRLEQGYGGINIVDWFDGTPTVRLLNGQATMVGRRRRGFLPAFTST